MKIPFDEEATLNYIVQEEDFELSWVDRQLGIKKSKIISTEELARQFKKRLETQKQNITFEPYKLNFILLAIVGIIFIGLMTNVLLNPKPNEGFNVFIPFVILFVVAGVIGVIFDKKRNFKIMMSRDGITIKEFSYQWNEIYKTYIVTRRKGKGYLYFLILALDNGVTDRYEFTNLMDFGETDKKIAAYIEHYKKIA
jgi:hypothetical protein